MSEAAPFFSVVVPTHNRLALLQRAVSSVVGQTFGDWELIVVDDGSTDGTPAAMAAEADARVRYLRQEHRERSAARNAGIAAARGTYLCFLDSDDLFLSNRLADVHTFVTRIPPPRPRLVLTGFEQRAPDGTLIREVEPPRDGEGVPEILRRFGVVPNCTVFVERDALGPNRFDERFSLWEDTHLWLRLIAGCSFVPLRSNSVSVMVHAESTVAATLSEVRLSDARRYRTAIDDLFHNHRALLRGVTDGDRRRYVDAKLKMFLYQAWVNGQRRVAWSLLREAVRNEPGPGNWWFYARTIAKLAIAGRPVTSSPTPAGNRRDR